MNHVGWGRVTRGDLDQLMEMNTRYHDLHAENPLFSADGSVDLAKHIRDSVVSTATGQTEESTLGRPQDHFVLLVGHDSNLSSLGGLLRPDWLLQDQTFNATPPGGALVFDVHKNHATGKKNVRVLFIS
jgi:4-phytase/acid phosphatase